jgi:hypothetical protein
MGGKRLLGTGAVEKFEGLFLDGRRARGAGESQISADGRITRWQERIMLPSIPLDSTDVVVVTPQGPDLDIDVKRKA